jgi:SAM-dependent methyltransferase/methyltransferase-like protein
MKARRMADGRESSSEHAGSEDYDALPYPSMPFAYTQPARLAALTELFALKAPDAAEARVLELGCASGGNIIPLAARFPRARFLGIDLSQRHIEDGRKRIKELELTNIDLELYDITKIDLSMRVFDYLICHGVFSWVPKHVQIAIFRICNEALAPNGVAVVSYNVFPGWHLRKIIRDICIHHVGTTGSPLSRVAKARIALNLIADSSTEAQAYGLLIKDEARRLATRPAAYIMGEFLAADNSPCYFNEFVEEAKNFKLTYLCDGELNSSLPEFKDIDIQRRIRSLAGPGHLAMEQYIDFFTGRTFRRSILIRSDKARVIKRRRSLDRLRSLHFASASAEALAPSDRLLPTTMSNPVVAGTLQCLINAYPGTLSYGEVVSGIEAKLSDANTESIPRALFSLVLAGKATASTLPIPAGRANAMPLKVWRVARLEAAAKQPWVTNLNHSPVPLHHLPAALLPYLDGSRNREALRPLIIQALLDGSIEAGTALSRRKSAQLDAAAEHYLRRALDQLEKHALLEA